jgi:hypothetical protein
MIIHILQNSYIGVREKYIFEFMLDTLGYFYQWRDKTDKIADSATILSYNPLKKDGINNSQSIQIPKIVDLNTIHKTALDWNEKELSGNRIPIFGMLDKVNNKSDLSIL